MCKRVNRLVKSYFVKFSQNILLRNFTIFKYQFTCIGTAHAQFIQLLCSSETLQIINVKFLELLHTMFPIFLFLVLLMMDYFHALFNDKCSDSVWSLGHIRFCIDNQNIRIRSIRNPHLVAIQYKLRSCFFEREKEGLETNFCEGPEKDDVSERRRRPFRSARSFIDTTSDPAFGSLIAKAPT